MLLQLCLSFLLIITLIRDTIVVARPLLRQDV